MIVNQVQDRYDGWGNVVQEWQPHSGAVDVQTTPSVQYAYGDGAAGGVAKYLRLTDVIYPNGRDVKYSYGQTQAIDDIMGQLATIGDGTNTFAAYNYLGAGKIATEDYQEASVKLDYTPNNLAALDRFGRVADQVWASYGANPATLDEYDYGYDRAGNRTSRANAVDTALSEMYGYNGVDELTSWSVNGVQQRTWSLDALGNDLASGTYNAANEETPTQGSSGYDLAGNMTTLQSGKTATYDAWNRLVEVDDASGIVEKFAYDGTNRRIQTLSDFSGSTPATVVDDYLDGEQVIESDVTTAGTRNGGYQYIWSARYIDAPILRDTLTTDGTSVVQAERVFYLSDANFNVTGLVKYDSGSGQWQVAERYTYDPYGVVTYRNGDWTTAASSANLNTLLYTGRTLDLLTSLYYNRARYYDPGLQRFVSRDPLTADVNLYRYSYNSPVIHVDPFGGKCVAKLVSEGGGPKHDSISDDYGMYWYLGWAGGWALGTAGKFTLDVTNNALTGTAKAQGWHIGWYWWKSKTYSAVATASGNVSCSCKDGKCYARATGGESIQAKDYALAMVKVVATEAGSSAKFTIVTYAGWTVDPTTTTKIGITVEGVSGEVEIHAPPVRNHLLSTREYAYECVME